MRTFKAIGALMMMALARMAEATATVTRWTLKAGRWVAETVAAPRRPEAALGNDAAAAVEALAEASKITTPAPDPTAGLDDRHDPVSAWGRTVMAYGKHRFAGGPQPDLSCLDDAARSWLQGLLWENHDRLAKLTPRQVGEHMLGINEVRGVPRCLTAAEYAEREAAADRLGLMRVPDLNDVMLEEGLRALTSKPGWTPNAGVN